jgi:hypothetical protein
MTVCGIPSVFGSMSGIPSGESMGLSVSSRLPKSFEKYVPLVCVLHHKTDSEEKTENGIE